MIDTIRGKLKWIPLCQPTRIKNFEDWAINLVIYAIYDNGSSFLDELSYSVKKLLGLKKCVLCDISHGWNIFGKQSWKNGEGVLDFIEWIHSDQQPDDLSEFTSNKLPCVVIRTGSKLKILFTTEELRAIKGDLSIFHGLLESKLQLSLDESWGVVTRAI